MIENRRGNSDIDLWNTFGFLLETSERLGLPSTFFFISGHSGGKVDGTYSMEDPWIRHLLREIGQRGHALGLHPSYNTFLDQNQLEKEFLVLRNAAEAEGFQQSQWGGRQHFLRWRAPTTWQQYEDVGLAYDATLTYPDRPGFRSGICDPYPVFNLQTRQPLKLIEQPLIVMDKALLGQGSVSMKDVRATIFRLKECCKHVNGMFSLLWHNGWLVSKREKALYLELLEA
jgi:peptidoglycan/xylan/chitin deacetylase (PgdA/CDA1 family)